MTSDLKPYKCKGCEKRFVGWGELRKHHDLCVPFIALQDGVERTRETQHAVARFADSGSVQGQRPNGPERWAA